MTRYFVSRLPYIVYNSKRHAHYTSGKEMFVFDRKTKLLQKERALTDPENKLAGYLKDEIGFRLYDNLLDIRRKFDTIVDLGCGRGSFSKHITPDLTNLLVMCERSSSLLDSSEEPKSGVKVKKLVVDEEKLPFEPGTIDIVVSGLSLHWVNDLPGTFFQIFCSLKNDGAFMATIFGGETLYELRSSFHLADVERCGGISPHVSPFTRVQDIGDILNQCGFTLQTIHTDEIIVGYPSLFELMRDLQLMGENNAAINRCGHLNRDAMLAAAAIYEEMYGEEGKIRATFQFINFIAWKPDPSQPKPMPRGSGQISFKDLHRLDEIIKEKGYVNLDDDKEKS